MSEKLQHVTDQDFEAVVLKSNKPVLVDFWATWCAPCRIIAPALEQVAAEYSDRARIVKLNVDENADVSARYNIRGIPTLLLFKDGVIKDQIVGVTSKDNIARMIENQL